MAQNECVKSHRPSRRNKTSLICAIQPQSEAAMWTDLEGQQGSPESGSWQDMLQSALSGLIICVLFLAAFAAVSAPRII